MTLYETRGGCIALCHRGCCIKICIRLLFPLKVHLLEVWIDVLMANSCSHMKAKSVQQSPSLCRTLFHSCSEREQCVCVHRVSSAPLTALNEPGQGAVSAGYLAPSANPSAPASGGAASKPGPDRSEEWMLIFFFQLRILITHSSRLDYETEIRLTEI